MVGLLATAAVGAVWTVASPDFGTPSVLARLGQADPVVLIAADGYRFGGKVYDRRDTVAELVAGLPSVRTVLTVDNLDQPAEWDLPVAAVGWAEALATEAPDQPDYADTAFGDPLWILWSSGTTGAPKGIVHSHGGIVLELLKAVGLHSDVQRGDRFFFVTSTSWMIWNFMVGGLLVGAAAVLHDGSPTWPDVDGAWRVAELTRADAIGCGAGYLMAGSNAGSSPGDTLDLSRVRTILQTGSTLPDHAWALDQRARVPDGPAQLDLRRDRHLLRAGRRQPAATGVRRADPGGRARRGPGAGTPTASRSSSRRASWSSPGRCPRCRCTSSTTRTAAATATATSPRSPASGGTATGSPSTVTGRSRSPADRTPPSTAAASGWARPRSTRSSSSCPRCPDSLVIGVERPDGTYLMPLFVVPVEGSDVDDALRAKITAALRSQLSPRHVPDEIVGVAAVPRTLTGKKLEVPVKRILQGTEPARVASPGAVSDYDMLDWFAGWSPGR